MQLTAHQLLLFGGAGAERLLLGQRERWGPPPGSPILPPAPQPLTCPPGGDPEPLGERPRRICPLGSRGPVPPCRAPLRGTAGRSRSGAGGGAGAAGTERGPRGRGGGGRGRSQVAQPARRGQEIPERRSQSGPACPGTGHRAFGSRRRPVLAGQGCSWGHRGLTALERGLEGLE